MRYMGNCIWESHVCVCVSPPPALAHTLTLESVYGHEGAGLGRQHPGVEVGQLGRVQVGPQHLHLEEERPQLADRPGGVVHLAADAVPVTRTLELPQKSERRRG